jgi:putative DNA methylase
MVDLDSNALASSILIACRPRSNDAPNATRREFVRALREELPSKLRILTGGVIDAVDLAQASIGPGMAVFSRYARVLEADGTPMNVGTALSLINEALDAYLSETTESESDAATRFCVAWYEKYGSADGPYGEADVLSKAKDVGIDRLERLGLLRARAGKVNLRTPSEFEPNPDWDPGLTAGVTVWEACHRLIEALERGAGEAGRLARRLGGTADAARDLAFRLYTIANKRGWTEDALAYNGLVASWTEIRTEAAKAAQETQASLG